MKRNAANDRAEGEAVLEADSEAGSSWLWPRPRRGGGLKLKSGVYGECGGRGGVLETFCLAKRKVQN